MSLRVNKPRLFSFLHDLTVFPVSALHQHISLQPMIFINITRQALTVGFLPPNTERCHARMDQDQDRRMGEGNIFSLSVSSHLGGGGLPPSRVRTCGEYPIPAPDRGTPSQVQTGRGGVPHPRRTFLLWKKRSIGDPVLVI